MEEEERMKSPSLAAHESHPPPLQRQPDGYETALPVYHFLSLFFNIKRIFGGLSRLGH